MVHRFFVFRLRIRNRFRFFVLAASKFLVQEVTRFASAIALLMTFENSVFEAGVAWCFQKISFI